MPQGGEKGEGGEYSLLWKRKIAQQDLGLPLLNSFVTADYLELKFSLPWDSHSRTAWYDLCSVVFEVKEWEFHCAAPSHSRFSQGKCDKPQKKSTREVQ